MELEIDEWVNQAPPTEKEFRKVVHTLIKAISLSDYLKPLMVMKGGMLLGLRYKSGRFTKDIDFSTQKKFQDFDIETFQAELHTSLQDAIDELNYGIDCRIQKIKSQPRIKEGEEDQRTTPSLVITIGYASKGSKEHKRLLDLQSPKTVKIDYSFNEYIPHPEELKIEGSEFSVYGIIDLISEKIRSVLQQIERKRSRRQDIYDLNFLINEIDDFSDEEKLLILETLRSKSKDRLELSQINKHALDNKEIYDRSKKEYDTLRNEVEGDLPDFDESFNRVKIFYKSLPWDNL
ncbi:nucleotidyl transferase AbiEii/AbiGii toxin family protein [Marinomonas sp. ef1]|uniref:nucleotidyl transferase AbiEii/AbiGii toxin family protein n=1 Tax=Marinomonas sp. ef1 TaxID=2005043 RepID=UPI000C28BEAB|nr:nucleotidyl transferase AbiEii/AbiGii toxin family protein [Marinomonas sp. ef1]